MAFFKDSEVAELQNEVRSLQFAVQSLNNELQTERERCEQLERRLATSAQTDVLTRATSLHAFADLLKGEHARAARYSLPYGLVSLELSNFLQIAGTHGYVAADRALMELANLIRRAIRSEVDHVGRTGPQEFCVLLPQTDSLGARLCARRIAEAARDEPITSQNAQIYLQPVFGIGIYSGAGELVAEDSVMNMARSARSRARFSEGTDIVEAPDIASVRLGNTAITG